MHRSDGTRPALSLLLGLAFSLSAPGQRAVQGLVFDPALEPLAGAEVSFHPRQRPDLTWLEDLTPDPKPLLARTDERGRYKIDGADRPGCLLVRHPSGLGALVPGAAPGSPDRVMARPLGALRVEGEDLPFIAHVTAVLAGRGQQYLGRFVHTDLRLPAGTYRVLFQRGELFGEHTCRVEEGRTTVLPPLQVGRALTIPSGFDGSVFLRGWPQPELTGRPLLIPPSRGPVILRVERRVGDDELFDRVWLTPDSTQLPLATPPAQWDEVQVVGPGDRGVAGARIYTVEPTGQGPVVRARSMTDAEGRGRHAAIQGARVLVLASGFGARLIDAEALSQRPEIRLAPGSNVDVRVVSDEPEVALVEVELRHSADSWLTFATFADRRGLARFRDLPPGDSTLRLLSPDHLPAELDVALPAKGELVLPARPGARVTGRVVLTDGDPAAGALVRLRDTTGQLREVRDAIADRQGQFAFGGLRDDSLFTISAELQRQGRTWSAQQRGIQPGDGGALLELRLEDPLPPHRRK